MKNEGEDMVTTRSNPRNQPEGQKIKNNPPDGNDTEALTDYARREESMTE